MVLVIDIGNTSITLKVYRGRSLFKEDGLDTSLKGKQLQLQLTKHFRHKHRLSLPLKGVVVCSVVPAALKIVEQVVRKELGLKPLVIGRDIKVPIKNRYRNPKQVGQDRLVCAYAAMQLYKVPVIVVDLGTAITFDIVSKRKEYLGGIIIPGIRLSADTLFQKAALLPKIKIQKPGALIGKDTEESILSGLFYGYGAMIQGLIRQIKQKISGKPKVIVTGGYTKLMKAYVGDKNVIINENLVFQGMLHIWQQYR